MHPILFEWGPIQIRYYGLMYAVAILFAIFLSRKEAIRRNINPDLMLEFVVYAVIGGIIAARLYYVAFNWSYYSYRPKDIFAIWKGGLAIHGGLIGGIIAGVIYGRIQKLNPWVLGDIAAPCIALGMVFGRFGNFMNGDAHGYPLHSEKLPPFLRGFPDWMGIVFPSGTMAGNEFPNTPLHPVMLYELVLNLINFAVLWGVRKKEYPRGTLFLVYIINYAIIRSAVTVFRADDLYVIPQVLRAPHAISAIMVAVAGVLLFVKYRNFEEERRILATEARERERAELREKFLERRRRMRKKKH
ncbi:MAG: prolipoprotein diacylglyceryl transferase [bacterium]